MATTSEQHVNFEGKSYGYYCRITYEAANGTVTVSKIEMRQDNTAHSYSAYYSYEQTVTLKIGDTTHSITKDYITRNSTSWFTSAEGSWSGNGSGAADITWTCKARSSTPNMLTFSWSVDPGYQPPSEVTLTNVTTSIGTASVSVYIQGAYTEVQYSKDGSNWQSSNTFNDLVHNQRYTFYARARNNTSSWTTSGGYSVIIPGYAPIIETITLAVGDTTCTFPTSGSGITYDNAQYAHATIKYRVEGTSSWATLTTFDSPAILFGLDIVTTYEYEYTITDSANGVSNTVTGTFTTTGQSKARLKINGTWKKGKVFLKKNGEWVVSKKIFIKKNGSWTETKN